MKIFTNITLALLVASAGLPLAAMNNDRVAVDKHYHTPFRQLVLDRDAKNQRPSSGESSNTYTQYFSPQAQADTSSSQPPAMIHADHAASPTVSEAPRAIVAIESNQVATSTTTRTLSDAAHLRAQDAAGSRSDDEDEDGDPLHDVYPNDDESSGDGSELMIPDTQPKIKTPAHNSIRSCVYAGIPVALAGAAYAAYCYMNGSIDYPVLLYFAGFNVGRLS